MLAIAVSILSQQGFFELCAVESEANESGLDPVVILGKHVCVIKSKAFSGCCLLGIAIASAF